MKQFWESPKSPEKVLRKSWESTKKQSWESPGKELLTWTDKQTSNRSNIAPSRFLFLDWEVMENLELGKKASSVAESTGNCFCLVFNERQSLQPLVTKNQNVRKYSNCDKIQTGTKTQILTKQKMWNVLVKTTRQHDNVMRCPRGSLLQSRDILGETGVLGWVKAIFMEDRTMEIPDWSILDLAGRLFLSWTFDIFFWEPLATRCLSPSKYAQMTAKWPPSKRQGTPKTPQNTHSGTPIDPKLPQSEHLISHSLMVWSLLLVIRCRPSPRGSTKAIPSTWPEINDKIIFHMFLGTFLWNDGVSSYWN